jgi:hypothetical protein
MSACDFRSRMQIILLTVLCLILVKYAACFGASIDINGEGEADNEYPISTSDSLKSEIGNKKVPECSENKIPGDLCNGVGSVHVDGLFDEDKTDLGNKKKSREGLMKNSDTDSSKNDDSNKMGTQSHNGSLGKKLQSQEGIPQRGPMKPFPDGEASKHLLKNKRFTSMNTSLTHQIPIYQHKLLNLSVINQNTRISREEWLNELEVKAERNYTSKKAFPVTASTFEVLRNHSGYIDKTVFILVFHYLLPTVTCFHRPRRSGKSMALQMTKSFYQVPKIDLEAYYSNDSKQLELDNSAESALKKTDINDPHYLANFFKGSKKDGDPDFVKNNMGKWPVISLDFKRVTFDQPSSITIEEIIKEIAEKVIIPAFDEYDYLLLLMMSQHACRIEYGSKSKKTVKDLYIDLKLERFKDIEGKINAIWNHFGKELSDHIQQFYRYYKGKITSVGDLNNAIPFLMKVLKDHYKRNVIVLVDEYDAPVQHIHKGVSFEDSIDNSQLMKSITFLGETISNFL